jgi:hypothetical protein
MAVLEVGRYHPQIFRVSSMHGFQIFLEAQRERNAMDVQDLKQMR